MTVHRFFNPGPHQKDSVKRIKDIVRVISNIKPDICHIHGTGVFSWAIYKELEHKSIPTISTVHGLVGVEKRKALMEHFSLKLFYQYIIQSHCEKRLLSAQNSVIVDTEYVAKAIKRYHLIKTPRIAIIPQGINNRFFDIDCSVSSRTLLSVGSISKRKGHHLLIKAFSMAAEKLKDIELVICGVLTDKSYFNELRKLAADTHCSGRISIKTDIQEEEVFEQYSKAHIFALHTQEESQGIVFAEAMATGLPIVSTLVGGVPYVVLDRENGVLTDYGDIGSFSQAIVSLFTFMDKWEAISLKNRIASRYYSWSEVAKRIEVEYTTILES